MSSSKQKRMKVFISSYRNLQMKDKEKRGRLSVVKDAPEEVTELYPGVDTILESFAGTNPLYLLVISTDKDGTIKCGFNTTSKAELLFLVEQFRHLLMNGDLDG
jgi:hypothetical protein